MPWVRGRQPGFLAPQPRGAFSSLKARIQLFVPHSHARASLGTKPGQVRVGLPAEWVLLGDLQVPIWCSQRVLKVPGAASQTCGMALSTLIWVVDCFPNCKMGQ